MSIIGFPGGEKPELSAEEKQQRVLKEVKRLAGFSPAEWKYQVRHSRAELFGLTPAEMERLVEAEVKEREKAARKVELEDRRREDKEERKRKAERKAIAAAAEKKQKAKAKALAEIAKLPTAEHDAKVVELAGRLDLDLSALREEFAEMVMVEAGRDGGSSPAHWRVEPWAEPVTTADLLVELVGKISKHVAVHPHEALVIALWTLMSWVHEVAATHSVFLVGTSAEPEAGKTTLLEVLFYLTPRPVTGTEITAANLVRLVYSERPTLIIDEADDPVHGGQRTHQGRQRLLEQLRENPEVGECRRHVGDAPVLAVLPEGLRPHRVELAAATDRALDHHQAVAQAARGGSLVRSPRRRRVRHAAPQVRALGHRSWSRTGNGQAAAAGRLQQPDRGQLAPSAGHRRARR